MAAGREQKLLGAEHNSFFLIPSAIFCPLVLAF